MPIKFINVNNIHELMNTNPEIMHIRFTFKFHDHLLPASRVYCSRLFYVQVAHLTCASVGGEPLESSFLQISMHEYMCEGVVFLCSDPTNIPIQTDTFLRSLKIPCV